MRRQFKCVVVYLGLPVFLLANTPAAPCAFSKVYALLLSSKLSDCATNSKVLTRAGFEDGDTGCCCRCKTTPDIRPAEPSPVAPRRCPCGPTCPGGLGGVCACCGLQLPFTLCHVHAATGLAQAMEVCSPDLERHLPSS